MENQIAGSRVLDSQYVINQLLNRDAKEINVANQEIVRIGNLCDVSFLRKINLSFNKVSSLVGIDQLPQLRELLAYSCQLEDVSHLQSVNKLEKLYLQHNRISSLGNTLQSMNKLQELRLDKNKLVKVEYISACTSLKKCNLAHNSIVSCEGINGLQYLLELNVSNNHIKSLASLKGLPQLRELDVSYNQLKSLDGIQYLLSLEIVHAEHNQIVHLQLPTYSPIMNTAATVATTNVSQVKKGASGSVNNKSASSGGVVIPSSAVKLPEVQGPIISELFLSGNRIKSIKGLEVYDKTLEILDLSSNQIGSTEIGELMNSLVQLSQLQEIRFYNNPCCEEGSRHSAFDEAKKLLREACRHLLAIDDDAIIKPSESLKQSSFMSIDSKEFHTWEKDGGSTASEGKKSEDSSKSVARASSSRKSLDEDAKADSSDLSSDEESSSKNKKLKTTPSTGSRKNSSSGKAATSSISKIGKQRSGSESKTIIEEDHEEEEEDENDPDVVNERLGLKVPKLTIKDVLSAEQIQEKEQSFLDLLTKTRDLLQSTVFKFEQLQKLTTEEERKEYEENELNKQLTSPRPEDKKRNFKIRKDVVLSEKLLTALDKVLEEKLEDENLLKLSPQPISPQIADFPTIVTEAKNAKVSVLTDQPVPVTLISTLANQSKCNPPSSSTVTVDVTDISAKFSPIADKIAASQVKKSINPVSSSNSNSVDSKNTELDEKVMPSHNRFAEKVAVKKVGRTEEVLPTAFASGKTLYGTKQIKSEFVITNSFLPKNHDVLHQQTSLPSDKDEKMASTLMSQGAEEIDFLNIKMSKPKNKLSYLQWMNHENFQDKRGQKVSEVFEKEESISSVPVKEKEEELKAENGNDEVALSLSYHQLESGLQIGDPEEVQLGEDARKIDLEMIARMYQKPHSIGFDARYGIVNDLQLVPDVVQLTPKDDLSYPSSEMIQRESFAVPPSSSRSIFTPRVNDTSIIRTDNSDTPTAKVVRANSAPQKRLENQLLSYLNVQLQKQDNLGSSSLSVSSETSASSSLPRFTIPQNARELIQKSYSHQNILFANKENQADKLSSISLEDQILRLSSKYRK